MRSDACRDQTAACSLVRPHDPTLAPLGHDVSECRVHCLLETIAVDRRRQEGLGVDERRKLLTGPDRPDILVGEIVPLPHGSTLLSEGLDQRRTAAERKVRHREPQFREMGRRRLLAAMRPLAESVAEIVGHCGHAGRAKSLVEMRADALGPSRT